MPIDLEAPSTPAERLAAVELAVRAIAARLDWTSPPLGELRVGDVAPLLPPTAVEELEMARLRVQARMYQLLGSEG